MPFPIPPGHRLAWDLDGTQVFFRRANDLGGDFMTPHPDALHAMNSSVLGGLLVPGSTGGGPTVWDKITETRTSSQQWFVFLFPEPMRIDGIFSLMVEVVSAGSVFRDPMPATVQFSTDTTNGIDGTWQELTSFSAVPSTADPVETVSLSHIDTGETLNQIGFPPSALYRHTQTVHGDGIEATNARRVRGLRFFPALPGGLGTFIYATVLVHLYGRPDVNATNDFLRAWSPTQDASMVPGWLAWDDAVPSSSADKVFRIKNLSDSLTAYDITISAQDESGYPAPYPKDQLLFSVDAGATWLDAVTIGALGPETVSGSVLIRRTTPSNSLLGSWSPIITFDVGSWS